MKSVLVLIDKEQISSALCRALQSDGFQVEIADTAEFASFRAANRHFDLIFIDDEVKSMNSPRPMELEERVELVHELRMMIHDVPVVMLFTPKDEFWELDSRYWIPHIVSTARQTLWRHELQTGERQSSTWKLGIGNLNRQPSAS